MKTQPEALPDELQLIDDKAARLAWLTLLYLISVVVALWLVAGTSQAMKAAWLQTLFSMVTPVLFLGARALARRPRDSHYSYGYQRWFSVAFLFASLSLFGLGIYLVADACLQLLGHQEQPQIGSIVLLERQVWLGWLMLAALAWSALPAWLIGMVQKPRAHALHDKVLNTDAKMRQADWLSASAAALGVFGIAGGLDWLDGVAGATIGLAVLWSGYQQFRHAVSDLADSSPTTVDGDWDDLQDRVRQRLCEFDWIVTADVRMREAGRSIMGEAFVLFTEDRDIAVRAAEATEAVQQMDWRIRSFGIIPVTADEDADRTQESSR